MQLRAMLNAQYPHFAKLDAIQPGHAEDIEKIAADGIAPSAAPFASPVSDFYMTNPIARASGVMAECSALARGLMKQAAE